MIVEIDMGYRIYVFRHIILHMLSQSYTGILLEKKTKKKKKGGKDTALLRFSDFPDHTTRGTRTPYGPMQH